MGEEVEWGGGQSAGRVTVQVLVFLPTSMELHFRAKGGDWLTHLWKGDPHHIYSLFPLHG